MVSANQSRCRWTTEIQQRLAQRSREDAYRRCDFVQICLHNTHERSPCGPAMWSRWRWRRLKRRERATKTFHNTTQLTLTYSFGWQWELALFYLNIVRIGCGEARFLSMAKKTCDIVTFKRNNNVHITLSLAIVGDGVRSPMPIICARITYVQISLALNTQCVAKSGDSRCKKHKFSLHLHTISVFGLGLGVPK